MSHVRILMSQVVFCDGGGVVHARYYEPHTPCGIDIIAVVMEHKARTLKELPMATYDRPRTIQDGSGLPLSRPTIPAVTCIACLTAMDD